MSLFDPPEIQMARKLIKNIEELEYLDIKDTDEVILEIRNLKKQGHYKRMIEAAKVKEKYAPVAKFTKEEGQKIRNLMLGFHNLGSRRELYLPPLTDLVTFSHFEALYVFLETLYYMNLGRKIEYEDALNIYFGGLDQRLIFALDKFDEVDETPELTAEFFQKLKKLKWQDKKSNNLYKNLKNAMFYVGETIFGSGFFGGTPSDFGVTEDFFNLFLAACSAVNDNRDAINQEDVIRAYKTYFKLIKTDITKYKAKPDLIQQSGFGLIQKNTKQGYLVCNKCNGYYKLQPGESPDDFPDTCDCGGELKYYEDIDWLLEKKEDSK